MQRKNVWGICRTNRKTGKLEALEIGQEGLPDIAAQGELGKFALALNVNEPGGLQFFEMMRKRRRRNGKTLAHIAAGGASRTGGEALHDFHAARIAQGFEDAQPLAGRESDGRRLAADFALLVTRRRIHNEPLLQSNHSPCSGACSVFYRAVSLSPTANRV